MAALEPVCTVGRDINAEIARRDGEISAEIYPRCDASTWRTQGLLLTYAAARDVCASGAATVGESAAKHRYSISRCMRNADRGRR